MRQITFAILALVPSMAGAQSAVSDACATSPTEIALLSCRKDQLAASEGRLAQAYERLRKSYADEPKRSALLSASESAWLAYRTAECRLRTFESAQGKAGEVYFLDCLKTVTDDRIKAMNALIAAP
jgi:uncharacterized protein YecT (DUF1311 family)